MPDLNRPCNGSIARLSACLPVYLMPCLVCLSNSEPILVAIQGPHAQAIAGRSARGHGQCQSMELCREQTDRRAKGELQH